MAEALQMKHAGMRLLDGIGIGIGGECLSVFLAACRFPAVVLLTWLLLGNIFPFLLIVV